MDKLKYESQILKSRAKLSEGINLQCAKKLRYNIKPESRI